MHQKLLRRYEPVICYTQGEMFFPCAIDGYLRRCSLWLADAQRNLTQVARPGELTPQTLTRYRSIPTDNRLYLRFVAEPLDVLAYQRQRLQSDRPAFHNPNRLERVGLVSRIVDGLFDASLLVRGQVPGGTVAVAEAQYNAMVAEDCRRVYYARVLRQGGYIILHYIFFYAMNDWRSSFHGVNDHESDWEQVFVYLSDERSDEGVSEPVPRWVAYASHDFSGDDLRRRWDDPELCKRDGTHPVIYAGAGSHASYFTPGEYLMQREPAFLQPLHGVNRALDQFWQRTLRQSGSLELDRALRELASIPFVDYARGDGLCIGAGQKETWTPVLISDEDGWVDGYRGLWGLDTWDPMGGERAPSGPKYNRDGTVRLSWSDPLGWAGLDKVLPPNREMEAMEELVATLQQERIDLEAARSQQREQVRTLGLEVDSLRQAAYFSQLLERRQSILTEEEAKLRALKARLNDVAETEEAVRERLARLRTGDFGSPRAHIRHAHTPQPPLPPTIRITRIWSAVSGGLLLLLIAGAFVWRPSNWPLWLVGIAAGFGAIEAATRRRLQSYLLGLTITLALITAGILLVQFWWLILILVLTALVLLMIRDNLSEIAQS